MDILETNSSSDIIRIHPSFIVCLVLVLANGNNELMSTHSLDHTKSQEWSITRDQDFHFPLECCTCVNIPHKTLTAQTLKGAGYSPFVCFITCPLAFLKIWFFTGPNLRASASSRLWNDFVLFTFKFPAAKSAATLTATFSKYANVLSIKIISVTFRFLHSFKLKGGGGLLDICWTQSWSQWFYCLIDQSQFLGPVRSDCLARQHQIKGCWQRCQLRKTLSPSTTR